ncbi:MAG: hypothetical protein SOR79_02840 [Blautia sp.]|uniref:hypothetical protein n=1 Tax=Blautia sp. TaxID=1955243 RepID=UPI002A7636C9|nr:hypothetical protein [Blautia sp.]MDY3016069.1 hypothetical protein [Blautia sp.]
MNWNNAKSKGKVNMLLAVLCSVLVLIMAALVVVDHRSTKKETEELTELAEEQKKGIEDYENVKKRVAELEKQSAVPEEEKENTTESDESGSDDKEGEDSSSEKE